ncbi:S-layer homology domain-containing protein, partial [Patescibacteria group bacterium]|nr:S-layer homology domain-containing protein [Patescibacteria group bacterium]
TTTGNVYVDDNPSAAVGVVSGYDTNVADGSKAKPYTKISLAINAIGDGNGTVHVAEGTYTENVSIVTNNISLIGSYNSSFGSTNLETTPSVYKGTFSMRDSSGSIEGFSFKEANSEQMYVLSLTKTNTAKSYVVKNNKFTDIDVSMSAIKVDAISGTGTGTITISNNKFVNVNSSEQAVINGSSAAPVIVDGNFISNSYAKNEGIIKVNTNDIVKNNIIVNSDTTAKSMIESLGAKIYNNTLAYNDNVETNAFGIPSASSKSAIKSTGNSEVYNNLIVESKYNPADNFHALSTVDSDTVSYNAIYPSIMQSGVITGDNAGVLYTCNPGFSKSSLDSGYKLKSDSECINNAKTLSAAGKDYFGTSRPIGSGYDFGAAEYTTNVFVGTIVPLDKPLFELVTPEPTTPEGELLENCTNGIDDNGNNLADCDDPACANTSYCDEEVVELEEICTNGQDDDGDTYVDCDDWDCNDHSFCADDSNVPSGNTDTETCDCNWSDLTSDFDGTAAKGLCEMDCIVGGYPDGTVRLNEKLNRAELLAIAFRASKYKNIYDVNMNADYCFNDVTSPSEGHWFAPYMCTGKTKGFIQGYDGNLAKPSNNVILAEGLKMMLGALDENYEINSTGKWYIDMVLNAADENQLPYTVDNSSDADNVGAVELTRGKAFNMLYRILKY